MSTLTAIALQLADDGDIDPETGHGPEWGKAAPIALLIIVLLGVALVFLLRSMNKQLHKVPASFDESAGGGSAVGRDGASTTTDVVGEAPATPAPPPDAGDAPPGR